MSGNCKKMINRACPQQTRKLQCREPHRTSVVITMRSRLTVASLIFAWLFAWPFSATNLSASQVRVRYHEGLTHGFLILSTLEGTHLAEGDLLEVAHGNRVTSRLVYHFYDGSLQDETVTFSQRGSFRLISYHLIQKGPAFKNATEVSVEASSGQVTVKYTDDKGNEKVENEHMKLPPDLANGLILTLMKNLPPNSGKTEVSMVVATPKPRVVKLAISPAGTDPFSLAGVKRGALHFAIKVEIGGVAGLIAPLLGKEPPDSHVWILGGEAPTFVKSEALSYMGGPLWRTELVAPVWPQTASEEKKSDKGAEK